MDLAQLDQLIPGSKHFRWREFLWCPTWAVYVVPTPAQSQNLIKLASVMDIIRERFGKPIGCTSVLRPARYNEWKYPYGVGGAPGSAHTEGKACDFTVMTIPPDEVQHELAPHLENLGIRMERHTSTWTHIDIRNPGREGNRHFYVKGSLG